MLSAGPDDFSGGVRKLCKATVVRRTRRPKLVGRAKSQEYLLTAGYLTDFVGMNSQPRGQKAPMQGKGLIITEKPSVAKDIVQALGGFEEKGKGDYFESESMVCTYAVGHILTLLEPEDINPIYKRWRLADLPIIPEDFKTKPVP